MNHRVSIKFVTTSTHHISLKILVSQTIHFFARARTHAHTHARTIYYNLLYYSDVIFHPLNLHNIYHVL